MTPTRMTGRIRPLASEDIPQVADLHLKVDSGPDETSTESLNSRRKHLTQVFLENPWRGETSDSLVYQEDDGRITGFIGVVPRRMSLNGKAVRAAIMSEFVVDSSARGFIGVQLLSKALAGPQDFSFSDQSNEAGRKMVERFGGITSIQYSTRCRSRGPRTGRSRQAGFQIPARSICSTFFPRGVDVREIIGVPGGTCGKALPSGGVRP